MWVELLFALGGALVGYVAGSTRAHAENARYLDQLDHWIDTQSRRVGAKPPLSEDDPWQ